MTIAVIAEQIAQPLKLAIGAHQITVQVQAQSAMKYVVTLEIMESMPVMMETKGTGTGKNYQFSFRCSSDCTVEVGFTCAGGSATTPDVCTEDCKDGLNMGVN